MKTHILWDHDGVLVHTEPWYFEATRRCIKPLGVDYQAADYRADNVLGHTAWRRARELGVTDSVIDQHKAQRDVLYQQFLRERSIEIEGVEQVLAELQRTYAMAIVTTAKKSDFALIHQDRAIVEHMSFVLVNGDYPRSKPAPDPYLAALLKFGIQPEQAVVIEDSARGLGAAVAANIDCVIVANEFMVGQDFSAASWRIDELAELPALLSQISSQ